MVEYHLGDAHQGRLEGGCSRGDDGRLAQGQRLLGLVAEVAHLGALQIALIERAVEPGHGRDNELVGWETLREGHHVGQVLLNLVHTAAGDKRNDGALVEVVRLAKLLARGERLTTQGDVVREGVATEGRGDAELSEPLRLEGEDGVETIDILLDLLYAVLLPGPRLGGDVVEDLDLLLLGPLGHLEVEARVVDQDQYIGLECLDVGLTLAKLTTNRAEVFQHIHKTEKRGLAVVLGKILRTARLGHQITTPKAKLRLRIGLFQPLTQFRAVQIARRLTDDQIISHIL